MSELGFSLGEKLPERADEGEFYLVDLFRNSIILLLVRGMNLLRTGVYKW
jgi:hypothetical protein